MHFSRTYPSYELLKSQEAIHLFFKKWANPDLFFIYFRSFQTNNKFYNKSMWIFLQQIKVYCAGIQTQDLLNMRHLP